MSRKSFFTVKGKPIFLTGGQVYNSTGYVISDLKPAFAGVKKLNGNSLAVPIFWEKFEPQEGVYDTTLLYETIDMARDEGIRLVLLWFGTWKNGVMSYCPEWIKEDPQRFQRVLASDGRPVYNLSCHCTENLEADKRAFAAFCAAVRDYDAEEETVVGIQVENEPGIWGGCRRDFQPAATAEFEANVPQELIDYIKADPDSLIASYWKQSGAAENGSWVQMLGRKGAEAFTAFTIARYINEVIKAGKKEYDILMYVNAALDGGSKGEGWEIPGYNYFGGGPVYKMRDIYYCFCKDADLVAPDDYKTEAMRHREMLDSYAFPEKGWPLYVPESHGNVINAADMIHGFANLGALGFHIWGPEFCIDENGELTEEAKSSANSFLMIKNIAPLLTKYYRSDKIHGFYQLTGESGFLLELDNWKCMVSYDGLMGFLPGHAHGGNDYRHQRLAEGNRDRQYEYWGDKGRGILVQTGPDEFFVVGEHIHILFSEYEPLDGSVPTTLLAPVLQMNTTQYLEATEGYFDEDGNYHAVRTRNGGEGHRGLWAEADCGVLHVRLHRQG